MGAAAAKMERAAMFQDDDMFMNHELCQDNIQAQCASPQSGLNRINGTAIQNKYPGIQEWIQENQKYLNQIIQNSNDDHVTIKVKEFLQLLQSGTPTQSPPVNYITSNAAYTAEAADDAVKFSCKFQINLLKIGWTVVPLFTDAVALAQSNVNFKPSSAALNLNQANRDVPLLPKGATYSYCIGVVQKCFALIAFYPGVYNVEMDILVPYSSSRKTGLVVALPKASSNRLTFRIKGKDILIKVDPALFSKHTSDSNMSVVECEFPPTSQLSVQWTENMGLSLSEPSEKVDQKVEVSATAEQQSLVSIGEGVLSIKTLVSYKIVSGQMSLFEIEIDDRIKVLHVEGLKHIPVKKWSVISNKKDKSNNNNEENLLSFNDESERKLAPNKSLLKVWLEYGLEDMYEFTVISELEMTGTSCQVTIPCFNCITKEVSRDRGFIGVEARTNVEIEEIECKAVEVIDISELPDSVFVMASNPLLFGYKFLEPPYHIVLDVKKHADVSVLIAVVESALYSVTYSEEGSLLYKFVFSVRNTQKQYLRVGIPKEAEIWTTLVQGSPVKPALDEKGLVMIPLEKASKSGQADHSFTIEFVYHLKGKPLEKQKSALDIEFPSCDIPINHLFVAVYLPEDYDYGEFTGMDEVKYWSRTPPSGNAAVPQQAKREQRRGVMPVRVDVPTSGSRFMFEQLLFSEKNIELSVPYKKRGKGCCGGKRRSQRTGCCC